MGWGARTNSKWNTTPANFISVLQKSAEYNIIEKYVIFLYIRRYTLHQTVIRSEALLYAKGDKRLFTKILNVIHRVISS